MVLGIPDFWIWSVFVLCFLSTALCVVYGLINWNKGGEEEPKQIEEAKSWEEKEEIVTEEKGL
ncbi:MAG: hypothetical protein GX099_04680 [Clostridiaceae bacterium]|nr:hypothetical protein [Oscillospiraceae bacterium]NLO62708.1 hypothetical protein [Clostridiaceae bacterium]